MKENNYSITCPVCSAEHDGTKTEVEKLGEQFARFEPKFIQALIEELKRAETFMAGFEDDEECNPGMKARLSHLRSILKHANKAGMNRPPVKVLVYVEGGVVQTVEATEKIECTVFDMDNEEASDEEEASETSKADAQARYEKLSADYPCLVF